MSSRTIKVRFEGDVDPLKRSSEEGRKAIDGWRGSMAKWGAAASIATVAIGAGMVAAGRVMIDTSRRMAELDTKAKAVFETELPTMKAWAEANRKAFGTSSREVLGMASNMADLLKPMGFTAKQAGAMSMKMLDLSGALSKWSNGTRSASEVSEILSAAMLGERDALQGLGIAISADEIKARLLAKGQDKLTGAAQQQAEAQATMALILEKSTDAQKAWANGGKEAAEQQQSLSSTLAETKEKLAAALTPAINAGAKALAGFASWAEKNQGTVKTIATVLAGLAAAIVVVTVAQKAWAVGTAIVTAVQTAWRVATLAGAAAQWLLNFAMTANPVVIIIMAIVALIAIIVLIATKTTWFQTAWKFAWGGIKAGAQAVGSWFMDTLWRKWILGAFNAIKERVDFTVLVFKLMVGRAKSVLSGIKDAILWPFKTAFNMVARLWNNSIGRLSIRVPDWVPIIGGKGFDFPRLPELARGGPARANRDYLVGERGPEILRMGSRGGTVIPNNAFSLVDGEEVGGRRGDTYVSVWIGSQQLAMMIRAEVTEYFREHRRGVLAMAGAR